MLGLAPRSSKSLDQDQYRVLRSRQLEPIASRHPFQPSIPCEKPPDSGRGLHQDKSIVCTSATHLNRDRLTEHGTPPHEARDRIACDMRTWSDSESYIGRLSHQVGFGFQSSSKKIKSMQKSAVTRSNFGSTGMVSHT